ncbi:hypothetical protein OROMI_013712 [Orobanche minor]
MEVTNSGNRRKSARLEMGKNNLNDGDLSNISSGQKRDGGYLSPLPKDIRKKTRMEGVPGRVIRRCLDPDFESPINRCKDKCFGEMKRHKHLDGEAKVFVKPKFLKKWNFYYDESNRNFHGKATYWNDFDVPQIILNKLSDVQRDLFMGTPFGQFLELQPPKMLSQIIHQALVREIYQRDSAEMWFEFGELRVHFGLPEFCLITGLRGDGFFELSEFEDLNSDLISKFFGGNRVTRALIDSTYKDAVFEDDNEAVRLSVIYLLFNYLLAAAPPRFVERAILNFAACGDLNVFPWGKVCFEQTLKSLSVAVKGSPRCLKNGSVEYNFFKNNYTKLYKLCGFPYCFQVFLYETIPTLMDRGICVLKEDSNLRISSWMESGKTPTNEQLNDTVFGSGQLRIEFLRPTVDELESMDFLEGFRFLQKADGGIGVEQNFVTRPKKVYIGSSVLNSEFKKLVEERLNSLESSIVKVSEAIEKLRCDFVGQLLTTQTEIIAQVKSIIKDVQSGHVDKRKSFGDVNESAEGVVIVDDILDGSGGAHSGSFKATPCLDGVSSQKNNDVLDKTIKNANNVAIEQFEARDEPRNEAADVETNVQNVATEKFEARDKPRDEDEDVEKEPIIQEYPSFDILCEGKSKCPEDEADMTSSNLMDDIIFSTQDIKIIDALEKSVGKVVTRGKRAVVMSSVCRSPFTTEFGSAECKEIVPYSKDIRKGLCAFPLECLKIPERHEIEMFEQWFRIGFNSRKRVYKFPGCSDIIDPPLSFGVTTVSSKMWFYNLLTPNKWLDHDHINICLYYLRKLARHSSHVLIKVTTVDSWFHVKLTNLYIDYCEKLGDINVLARDTDICDYILGYSMCVNTPWVDVDYILFPINMDGPAHWFLLVFDVHRRRLVVYNTFNPNSINMQTKIMDVCEPYILGLPIILSYCGFWNGRKDIDFRSPWYCDKGFEDAIELEFEKSVPEQVQCDCGVFTIGFAEYFMWRRMDDFCRRFEVKEYRNKLCVYLFLHGRRKEISGYESDTEFRGRRPVTKCTAKV